MTVAEHRPAAASTGDAGGRGQRSLLGDVLRMGRHTILDRLRRPRAVDPDDVPYCLDAITPEWLTASLCQDAPACAVTAVELSGRSSGSTVRGRLRLSYSGSPGNADLPDTLFAKSSPRFFNRIALVSSDTIRTEALFYREIRPQLGIEAPRGYLCRYDLETGRSVQLMEDLAATKGATFCTPLSHIDRDKAEQIVRLLADFHGQFYGRADLAEAYPWVWSYPEWFRGAHERFGLRRYHDRALAKIADILPPTVRARAGEIWDAKVATNRDHETLPRTLLHGDVHLGNWYVTDAGRMGLCDWQCVVSGCFAQDLAYAMTTTLRIEDRRAWEHDLIAVYVEAFNLRATTPLTFGEAWYLYRRHAMAGLIMWTVTLVHSPLMPDMQPEATSIEMLRRASAAMADLGTLDLAR